MVAAAAVLTLAVVAAPAGAAPTQQPDGGKITFTPLKASSRAQGAKAPSSRLARTDKALLSLESAKPEHVIVKLNYDATASYQGGIKGLPATSPAATGQGIDRSSENVRRYEGFAQGVERDFLDALRARLPQAKPGRRLRTTYGGVALTLPGNQIPTLLELPGVLAVQRDAVNHPLTDSSPAFIGTPTAYGKLGGAATAGKGVIVGVLDTGSWPEHPSYATNPALPPRPPMSDGTPRACDFGDNPATPAPDAFACNNKLISGQPFIDTYNAVVGGEVYPDSARDSNGHGTHTSTTAAGGAVAHATVLGVDRGAVHGVAPGAQVAVYKVCGLQGCFSSDSVAAVEQAILDGVDVINFSISGGVDPYTDPVELAFLDAYAAGVVVAASAGNEGPGAATVNHNGPWVVTVAASTQRRAFESTVTLSGGGATATVKGASITAGVTSPLPVVRASDPPYSRALCDAPAPAGLFTGKIVACQRGVNARVEKGFNVLQGGAAGMLLYNPTVQDVETDNHWLPTAHLDGPAGQTLLAFLAAHPGASASFTAGQKVNDQGDVMAAFSSRGPGADWLKPDVTAPGVQILAGHTPTPEDNIGGPRGQLFQAIAGTSMSSPHVAGSAALLKALRPSWTPGQIKSALMTTATMAGVVEENKTTRVDPFDVGGGRVDLTKAGNPGLTFDEQAEDYAAAGTDPLDRVDLNLPSVNAPVMPGELTTTRVAKNVSSVPLIYSVSTTAPAGASIKVSPSTFFVRSGRSVTLTITISAPTLAQGQYFGRIDLNTLMPSQRLHLPVAFFKKQGVVTLAQSCAPASIAKTSGRSTCSVTVQNNATARAQASATSSVGAGLQITSASGATRRGDGTVVAAKTLSARVPDAPTIAPGSLAGFKPLPAAFFNSLGDEEAINFTGVPAFEFAGESYTSVGVTSNGYLVAGGATGQDITFEPQTLPNAAPPNGVLAPFWSDLDGTGAPGVGAAFAEDEAGNRWLVIEWRLNIFATTSLRVFQTWIGLNGIEDITFAYDPAALPGAVPPGNGLTVGAENAEGSAGDQIDGLPTQDLRVASTPGAAGGTLTYSYQVQGTASGTRRARTDLRTALVRGVTIEVDTIRVQ